MRVGIVATHPIQYQAPWFRALARRSELDLTVYFGMIPTPRQQAAGFGGAFEWDLPLRDGYRSTVLTSASATPRLAGFFGNRASGLGKTFAADRLEALIVTGWGKSVLVQALREARGLAIPVLVRGESTPLKRRSAIQRMAHRKLLSRYDAFLAIGAWNRDFYLENGVEAAKIFSCPYFVDNDRFSGERTRLEPERASIRAGWGIAPGATCVLVAGKLQPKKRLLDLLGAAQSAFARGGASHLLVVGDGDERRAAEERVRRGAMPATFAGFLNQSEIVRAYCAADCLVLPSDENETWGLVVNEAMACGLPTIVSDRVGCGPDLVEEGVTGSIFPMGDVEALAAKLAEYAGNASAASAMGERARERVLRAYSVEKAVEGTVAALQSVAGRKRAA